MSQRISIIMPTYNRGYCIDRAIKSVMQQTYRDWELIIVDDGSTDNTEEVVQSFKKTLGTKLNYFKKVNEGVSVARNVAIKRSCGDFIGFLDSDDYYYPTKLDRQIKALNDNPESVMCYTNWSTFYDGNEDGAMFHPLPEDLKGFIYPQLISVQNCFITTPSVLLRREALFKAGLFDISMHICEDIDLWRRISRLGPVVQIFEPLIGVHLRKEEEFNYIRSIEARMTLYERAHLDDPLIPVSVFGVMMADIYQAYVGVAKYRGNITYIESLEHAENMARSAKSWDILDLTLKDCVRILRDSGHF